MITNMSKRTTNLLPILATVVWSSSLFLQTASQPVIKESSEDSLKQVAELVKAKQYTNATTQLLKGKNPSEDIVTFVQTNFDQTDHFDKGIDPRDILKFITSGVGRENQTGSCVVASAGIIAFADKIVAPIKDDDDTSFLEKIAWATLFLVEDGWMSDTNCTGEGQKSKEKTAAQLKAKVFRVIDEWAEGIRNYRDHTQFTDEKYFKIYMGDIVRATYAGNRSNFEPTALYVSRFVGIPLKIGGWIQLSNDLNKDVNAGGVEPHSKEMMKFAYYIRKDVENQNSSLALGSGEIHLLEPIIARIPAELKQLLWGERCSIRNEQTRQYIHKDKLFKKLLLNSNGPDAGNNNTGRNEGGWWKLKPFVETDDEGHVTPGIKFAIEYWQKGENNENEVSQTFLCLNESNKMETVKPELCLKETEGSGFLESEKTPSWSLNPVLGSLTFGGTGNTTSKKEAYRLLTTNSKGEQFALRVIDGKTGKELALEVETQPKINYDNSYNWLITCEETKIVGVH